MMAYAPANACLPRRAFGKGGCPSPKYDIVFRFYFRRGRQAEETLAVRENW